MSTNTQTKPSSKPKYLPNKEQTPLPILLTASTTGAILTALLVSPLDVLKVRQQTSSFLPRVTTKYVGKNVVVESKLKDLVIVNAGITKCLIPSTAIGTDCAPKKIPTSQASAATQRLPPTLSNIIALAALSPESGVYTSDQVHRLLQTAYTGFRTLVLRSERVTLHTGYWGCGAFGGNKGLVAAVQLLAAGAAGIERVQFWWGQTELDRSALEHAIAVQQHLSGASVEEAIAKLVAAGYRWGVANENHVPYEPPTNCMLGE